MFTRVISRRNVLICMWYRNGYRMLLLLCILSANCRIHFRVTKSKWDYEPSYSGSESSVSPRHCISEKELWVISIPSLCIWNVVFSNETLTPQFLPLVKTIFIRSVHFPSPINQFSLFQISSKKRTTIHIYTSPFFSLLSLPPLHLLIETVRYRSIIPGTTFFIYGTKLIIGRFNAKNRVRINADTYGRAEVKTISRRRRLKRLKPEFPNR